MGDKQALDIIKGAILLERRGKAFYENTAEKTNSPAVREIFEMMAAEENKHINILTRHFESLLHEGNLSALDYDDKPEDFSVAFLTNKIQEEISAAGYEAAAISAAIAMEDKAVTYYSKRANSTDNPLEKELYQWLSNWEKTHLQLLSKIDNDLQERVWYDNQFWPM